MNPLEAMACRMYRHEMGDDANWDAEPDCERTRWVDLARAALDALADNVSEKMVDAALTGPAMRSLKDGIAAAIRAAGEV